MVRDTRTMAEGNVADQHIQVVTPASLLVKPLQAEIVNQQGMVIASKMVSNTRSTFDVNHLASG